MADTPEDLDISDELIAERRGGEPGDLPWNMRPWMRQTITVLDTFIYVGMMQFMVIQLLGLIMILLFPQIALWLPTYIYGG